MYVKPYWISLVRAQNGSIMYQNKPETRQVLDPRVNYLMVSMLEEVLRSGTAAGVRARGFTVPAAGKTGTSRDGWFAGFTSELLCIVWVGFDDNRELNLEGAHSALPIWAEFMKRALAISRLPGCQAVSRRPDGIVSVEIDPQSGMPATPFCPLTKTEVFIAGTQPVGTCPLHGGSNPGATHVAGWDVPPPPTIGPQNGAQIASNDPRLRHPAAAGAAAAPNSPADHSRDQQDQKPEKKKGLFRRLMDVFK